MRNHRIFIKSQSYPFLSHKIKYIEFYLKVINRYLSGVEGSPIEFP